MLNEGYNYPNYPNHHNGKNLLIYINKNLIGRKNNKKNPIYPPFIPKDGDNRYSLIRSFLRIADNYILDDNNNLYIKYYKKNAGNKKKDITNNTRKKFVEFEYFEVPFTKNIYEYLSSIHKQMNHRGITSLREELIKRKISYFGINNDIKKVINNCSVCMLKRNTNLKKKKKLD